MKAIAYVTATIALAAGLAGCSSSYVLMDETSRCDASCLRNGPIEKISLSEPEDYKKHFGDSQEFVKMLVSISSEGKAAGDNKPTADEIFLLGAGYVDQKCDEYFVALFRYQEYMRTASADISLAGSTGAGLLSALSASAKAIQVMALGSTFAAGFTENSAAVLLSEVNVGDTRRLVTRAQRAFTDNLDRRLIATPMLAVETLRRYARLCLPSSIETQVREAIRVANFSDLGAEARQGVSAQAVEALRTSISKSLGVTPPLSDQKLAALYLYLLDYKDSSSSAAYKQKMEAELGVDLATQLKAQEAKLEPVKMQLETLANFTALDDNARALRIALQAAATTPPREDGAGAAAPAAPAAAPLAAPASGGVGVASPPVPTAVDSASPK